MTEQLFLAPFHDNDPATSRAAALSVDAAGQRRRVLLALFAAGESGMTDDELSSRCGLIRTSAGTRRGVLVKEGFVRRTSETRPTPFGRPAHVWTITSEGREEARRLMEEAA